MNDEGYWNKTLNVPYVSCSLKRRAPFYWHIEGNFLPVMDFLLDFLKPPHQMASNTLLCFQHPLHFELESQYQLISSKQADMLITKPLFFSIPYYKVKQAETCKVDQKVNVSPKINVSKFKPLPIFFLFPEVSISANVEFTSLLMWRIFSSLIHLNGLKSGRWWKGCTSIKIIFP